MSWEASAAVASLPYDVCGHGAYRVLSKLANVADSEGKGAWQFDPKMANELGVSVRSIIRWRAELETQQLVRRAADQARVGHWRGGNRPVVYDINMHAGPQTMTPLLVDEELLGYDFEAFRADPVRSQCPRNNGGPHRFDPSSGWCQCGIRDDT